MKIDRICSKKIELEQCSNANQANEGDDRKKVKYEKVHGDTDTVNIFS